MEVRVLVDGSPRSAVPATDSSVLRGDGCFEAVRSYGGNLFRLDDHLARLRRSAEMLDLEMPGTERIRGWMQSVAAGDCVVRVVLSRGSAVPGLDAPGVCVVVAHPLPPMRHEVRLWPVVAPWHPAGRDWELAGAKTISYAPNLAAGRRAVRAGADEALLLSDEGIVLEGPTFSVGWCRAGRVFTSPLDLGILDSITRRTVIEIYAGVEERRRTLEEVLEADEVFTMSTVHEITPVVAVGETEFSAGPVTEKIAQRFSELVKQPGT